MSTVDSTGRHRGRWAPRCRPGSGQLAVQVGVGAVLVPFDPGHGTAATGW